MRPQTDGYNDHDGHSHDGMFSQRWYVCELAIFLKYTVFHIFIAVAIMVVAVMV